MMKLSVVCAILLFGQYAAASFCQCGLGPGEDMCKPIQKSCTPLVVRPVELPKPYNPGPPKQICVPAPPPPPPVPLTPIPGPCSVTKAIVKPAFVPPPSCTTCQRKTCTHQNTNTIITNENQVLVNGNTVLNGCGGGSVIQYPQAPIYITDGPAAAPADPVSLSLAYKMAQKKCMAHNEDILSFGFRKLPKELPPKPVKEKVNIPEENLYSLNGQIVELKPIACGSGKSVDEEAAEELLALSEEEVEVPNQIRKVSLGEIGYGPAKIQPATFVDVPLANPIEAVADALTSGQKATCNDGFVPGGVVFKTIPKPPSIAIQPKLPCEEPEEHADLPQGTGYGLNGASCSCYQQHHHSSSYQNTATKNIFLQKLTGCL